MIVVMVCGSTGSKALRSDASLCLLLRVENARVDTDARAVSNMVESDDCEDVLLADCFGAVF